MQTKMWVGAAVLAVTCLAGGAVLSGNVLASGRDAEHAEQVAALQQQIDEGRQNAQALADQLDERKARRASRLSELSKELEAARRELAEKDEALAAFEARLAAIPAAAADEAPAGDDPSKDRAEQWAELRKKMSGVMDMLRKMGAEGANQFELGPQLVAELGRISPEEFDALMAFDATETDPGIVNEIQSIMLQALIFVPGVSSERNDYMQRYIERAQSGRFGEDFSAGALRRVSFTMPPFVDGYAKIIEPLDEEVQAKFLDVAIERAARGDSESKRVDGAKYLGHVDDPRATTELLRVFGETSNSRRLRMTALKGLSLRSDANVLSTLRDAEAAEDDPDMRTQIERAAALVESRIAEQR